MSEPAMSEPATPEAADSAGEQAPSEPVTMHTAPGAPTPAAAPRVQTQVTEEIHPPRWDPLGAAPFAWDLPEPSAATPPAPVPVPRRRGRVTPVTLGAALLTAAAIATLNMIGLTSISGVMGAAIVLGVVGAGLVIGAFLRSGYGLLAVAIPLAGFVIVGTMAENVMTGYAGAPIGDRQFSPSAPGDLRDEYVLQAGDLQLDLRQLTLDHDRTVITRVGVGQTRITVPETMNVTVTCDVSVGEARCPESLNRVITPGAPTLTIDAQGNVGDMEVTRVR